MKLFLLPDLSYLNVCKQKVQVIRRSQVFFSSSNVLTDTTVFVKD